MPSTTSTSSNSFKETSTTRMSSTSNNKRKMTSNVGNVGSAKKKASPPWHKIDPPKYVTGTFQGLHPMHKALVEKMVTMLDNTNGMYLEAPSGSGKTSLLSHLYKPCTATSKVLNIAALSSMELLDEAIRESGLSYSVPPPFSPFNEPKQDHARRLLQGVKEGETVAIPVTHSFLQQKLKPRKTHPDHDLARFVADMGSPQIVQFIIDEAHSLCTEEWAKSMAKYREELAATTVVKVILLSATPNLETPRFLRAAAQMLGVDAKLLTDRTLVASPAVDEVAQFKSDTCKLKPPKATWDAADLPTPYPNEALETVLDTPLKDAGVIVVGDMLFLLGQKVAGKKRRQRSIDAIHARSNLIANVVATLAHHSHDGDNTKGGHVFAALKDKVKACTVVDGAIDGRKAKKVDECVLIVHSAKEGVEAHLEMLQDNVKGGANGVPAYKAFDIGTGNAARCKDQRHAFLQAFQTQEEGMALGVLTPDKVVGTGAFATALTTILLIGPMTDGVKHQGRGRVDRPKDLRPLEGKLVRGERTRLLHLDSPWANELGTATTFNKKNEVDMLDCDAALRARLIAIREGGEYAPDANKLLQQMALRLASIQGRLLPGDLVDLFLACVEDPEEGKKFMSREAVEDDTLTTYWQTVAKWNGASSGVEDAGADDDVDEQELFGEDETDAE